MPIPTYQRMQAELPEFTIDPPFAGIQSEMCADDVENVGGFLDCPNMMLWNGRCRVRPELKALPPIPDGSPVVGAADFYDYKEVRHQIAITTGGNFYEFMTGTGVWNQITGTLTAGNALYSFAVVGYKLCFCNGVDPIQMWDGTTASFAPVTPNGFSARFLLELNTHLIALSTIESATAYPQRVRWSGANDPTDWVSFNAGINDILSDLGPIYGGSKVGQQGIIQHVDGVTQMIPTGIGVSPFYFYPLGAREHGCGFPFSIASIPDIGTFFASKDNVYLLDVSFNFVPIGAFPDQSGHKRGARSAILAELRSANVNRVFGFVCVAINGNSYLSYWLVIPGGSTWVYNISEGNWTRFTFEKNLNVVNRLYNDTAPTWSQLVGTWTDQTATWADLSAINPFDFVFFGFSDGTCAYMDFSGYSEQPWNVTGPTQPFGDRRHTKSLERFRLVCEDMGAVTASMYFSTENGSNDTQAVSYGSGSGLSLDVVINTKLSGVYHSWVLSGGPGVPASFTEFAPLYVPGGEYKNNP